MANVLAPASLAFDEAELYPWGQGFRYSQCSWGSKTTGKYTDSRDTAESAAAPWFRYLEELILKSSLPQMGNTQSNAQVSCLIDIVGAKTHGKIKLLRIDKSSGEPQIDKNFELSILNSGPVLFQPPLILSHLEAYRAIWKNGSVSIEPVRITAAKAKESPTLAPILGK